MKTIILLLALSVFLSHGCRNVTVKPVPSEINGVRAERVTTVTMSIPVHSSGVLVSSEEVKLSFKTGGIVARIPVREGDRVKKGDLLASLNLAEINAQESLARDGYDKALRDYTRVKHLYADSVATLEQMQNAGTAMSLAESNLNIVLFNLAHSEIRAPENGIILKQFVKENELTAPGYPIFLFGTSKGNWKIRTALSDRDIVKINPGDSGSVTLDAWPGVRFSGVVDQVGEISDPLTGTYEIELTLASTGYRLAAGFIAGVELIPSGKESYILIPLESIVEADGMEGYIFALRDSSTVQKVRIGIAAIIGSRAAIRRSPWVMKEIVTDGAAYLRDGEKVKIIR